MFDNFGVFLKEFSNNELYMSLLNCLIDTESALNVYTNQVNEKTQNVHKIAPKRRKFFMFCHSISEIAKLSSFPICTALLAIPFGAYLTFEK